MGNTDTGRLALMPLPRAFSLFRALVAQEPCFGSLRKCYRFPYGVAACALRCRRFGGDFEITVIARDISRDNIDAHRPLILFTPHF